jgi:hypothetical protein
MLTSKHGIVQCLFASTPCDLPVCPVLNESTKRQFHAYSSRSAAPEHPFHIVHLLLSRVIRVE